MNVRKSASSVPATILIPGDTIVHPVDSSPVRIATVDRVGPNVVLTIRGNWPLVLPATYRVALGR